MLTRMTVAAQGYLLSEDTDVGALQVEVCDAIRRGSGIVTVDRAAGRPVTLVVSPGVPVTFEEVVDAVESPTASESTMSLDEWETYF